MIEQFLDEIIEKAESIGASDVHITADRYANYRVKGTLHLDTGGRKYSMSDLTQMFQKLGLNMQNYETTGACDAGLTLRNSRLRLHFYRSLGNMSLSIRLLPSSIPDFSTLQLPKVLLDFIKKRTGLVIVTGATGSGKSTTLASMIEYTNQQKDKKIITVEDPIEYIYEDKKSLIMQREIGIDVPSFEKAISQAMREDPNILLVGELRDLDTIKSALSMAETGHLVFGTLHTRGAAESFNRLIDVFPGDQRDEIRTQLAGLTQGVISQQLIYSSKLDNLVPLVEVLVMTQGARGSIATGGNLSNLKDAIQQGHQKHHSQSFGQSAAQLIADGKLALEDIKDVFDEEEIKKLRANLSGRLHK